MLSLMGNFTPHHLLFFRVLLDLKATKCQDMIAQNPNFLHAVLVINKKCINLYEDCSPDVEQNPNLKDTCIQVLTLSHTGQLRFRGHNKSMGAGI